MYQRYTKGFLGGSLSVRCAFFFLVLAASINNVYSSSFRHRELISPAIMMLAAGFQLGVGGIVFMLKTVRCWNMQPEMIIATSMLILTHLVCLFLVYVSGKP
jgi:hypothetical protein